MSKAQCQELLSRSSSSPGASPSQDKTNTHDIVVKTLDSVESRTKLSGVGAKCLQFREEGWEVTWPEEAELGCGSCLHPRGEAESRVHSMNESDS